MGVGRAEGAGRGGPPIRVILSETVLNLGVMARTSKTTQARRVARARLAEKIEGRRKREQAELEHITDFEAALARRAQAEAEMAAAVAGLIGLGNTVAEAAELTEQTEGEIRRLRKLAAAANGDQCAAGEDVGGRDDTAERASRKASRSTPGPAGAGQDALVFDAVVPMDARS